MKVLTSPIKLSLNNSLFSGFVVPPLPPPDRGGGEGDLRGPHGDPPLDGEGCFNVYVAKNNKNVSLRFIVDQREGLFLFNDLKNILSYGSIYKRKNSNYRYAVTNLNSLSVIINYFNQFVLRTKNNDPSINE